MEIFVGMTECHSLGQNNDLLWNRRFVDVFHRTSSFLLEYNKGITKISSRNYSSLPPKIGVTAEQPNMPAA